MDDDKLELDPILSLDDLSDRVKGFAYGFGDRPMWFRGQRDATWHLHASIFRHRKNRVTGVLLSFDQKREQEREVANTFRQRASMRREKCPREGDDFGWLALMRHYYAACRLLDWSESALVALYCAVCAVVSEEGETDSRLWFLDPAILNRCAFVNSYGQRQLEAGRPLTPDHELVAGRARAAFDENAEIKPMDKSPTPTARVRTENRDIVGPPLAVVPSENNNRMLVQSSVFTLQSDSKPLDDCGINEQIVWSAVIPKGVRTPLRETLHNLGINRNLLFPDLEDLAKWLNEKVGLGEAVDEQVEEAKEPIS